MKEDIQFFLEEQEGIKGLLSPSSTLFPDLSSEPTPEDKQAAQLSLFSGRAEYWQFVVLLVAFAESRIEDPNQLLTEIVGKASPTKESFTNFCSTRISVDPDTLASTAFGVQSALNEGSLVLTSSSFDVLKECAKLHPGDDRAVAQCLRKKLAGGKVKQREPALV